MVDMVQSLSRSALSLSPWSLCLRWSIVWSSLAPKEN